MTNTTPIDLTTIPTPATDAARDMQAVHDGAYAGWASEREPQLRAMTKAALLGLDSIDARSFRGATKDEVIASVLSAEWATTETADRLEKARLAMRKEESALWYMEQYANGDGIRAAQQKAADAAMSDSWWSGETVINAGVDLTKARAEARLWGQAAQRCVDADVSPLTAVREVAESALMEIVSHVRAGLHRSTSEASNLAAEAEESARADFVRTATGLVGGINLARYPY